MTLDEIGIKHQTDKSSSGHSYLKFYEQHFKELKDTELRLMEIGVWEGASLRMWEEYFPKAHVVGLDIHEKVQYDTNRIETLICDQSNVEDLMRIGAQFDQNVDIIIDDGSHNADDQILSFEILFRHLKKGGYYCIEDCLCSYDKSRWGKNASVYDRIKQMVDEVNMSGKISNNEINANKQIQVIRYGYDDYLTYFEKHIESIFVSTGLVIIKKM